MELGLFLIQARGSGLLLMAARCAEAVWLVRRLRIGRNRRVLRGIAGLPPRPLVWAGGRRGFTEFAGGLLLAFGLAGTAADPR